VSPRKRKSKKGSVLSGVGPVFLSFIIGAVMVMFLVGGGYLPWLVPQERAESELQTTVDDLRLKALKIFLDGQADWQGGEPGIGSGWEGRLPNSESLVQWNARITDGIEAIGLQVLSGQEEIVHRKNRQPLQRLTMTIGEETGEFLTTVMVEIVRSDNLPSVF
jgi:hypothetical protein